MDPLSITANVVGIVLFAGSIAQKIGRFVVDTKEAPDTISEFHETIRNLESALLNITEVLEHRPRQLPFEKEHHNKISQILGSCDAALRRLDNHLPELPDDIKTIAKIRMNLSLSLRKEPIRQILSHIQSYTQVLQLSLITLSLGSLWGTQRSQDRIQAEIRNLTDSIRSSGLAQPRTDAIATPAATLLEGETIPTDQDSVLTQEIRDWRMTADDVAAAVSLWDPDQASLDARRTVTDSGIDVGSNNAAEVEFEDFDPEPHRADYASRDILLQQIEHNKTSVSQLISCGIFLKAAAFQRRGIQWKIELWEAHRVPFTWDEQADMEEELASTLLSSDTVNGVVEAKDILKKLLKEQITRLSGNEGTPTVSSDPSALERRSRLYHRLGEIYMSHHNIPNAKRFLLRAFEGRRELATVSLPDILETCNLLIKVFQLDQAFVEAAAHIQWRDEQIRLHLELSPRPRLSISSPELDSDEQNAGANGISSAFAWCKAHDFDVDARDFSFETCDPVRGTSPLHLVILEETVDVAHQIIDHVVSFEHRDIDFATPLLLAAATRNRITTQALLDRGAKVDVRDRRGMSPLHRCQSEKGGVKVAELLIECNKNASALASSLRQEPNIINFADSNGKTALYMACERGNKKMVQALLSHGANADVTDDYGKTPLYMAAQKGDEVMVYHLLEGGASPNIQGPGLQTPLLVAIEAPTRISVKIAIVEALLARGADPCIGDAVEQTAFTAAKKAGFGSEIRRLLDKAEPRRATSISSVASSESFRSRSGSGSMFSNSISSHGMFRPREDSTTSRVSVFRR